MSPNNWKGNALPVCSNWPVTDGSVDLVAHGDWGLDCAGLSGKCVDLDGSTGQAGTFESLDLSLTAGTYRLSFDISGSQRRWSQSDTMDVTLGGFINEDITCIWSDYWETITLDFDVLTDTTDSIVFNHAGRDNMGIVLDNFTLESV